MRLAVLADIHGNLPALEAVLADLHTHTPDAVYLLGDQVNRCPWNNEVLDLLATQGWPALQGNHEYVIGIIRTAQNHAPFTSQTHYPTEWWTQAQLHPHYLTQMRNLPAEHSVNLPGCAPLRLVHGVPGNAFIGFYPGSATAYVVDLLRTVDEAYLICAHTHRPLVRQVDRWWIFNGGSVGMPYNGDPRAHYLLLDWVDHHWQPTLRQVDYDHTGLAAAFAASGFLAEVGPMAQLHLRTVLTGHPWSSDFGYWRHTQPAPLQHDLERALEVYLQSHGPGQWAFPEG